MDSCPTVAMSAGITDLLSANAEEIGWVMAWYDRLPPWLWAPFGVAVAALGGCAYCFIKPSKDEGESGDEDEEGGGESGSDE